MRYFRVDGKDRLSYAASKAASTRKGAIPFSDAIAIWVCEPGGSVMERGEKLPARGEFAMGFPVLGGGLANGASEVLAKLGVMGDGITVIDDCTTARAGAAGKKTPARRYQVASFNGRPSMCFAIVTRERLYPLAVLGRAEASISGGTRSSESALARWVASLSRACDAPIVTSTLELAELRARHLLGSAKGAWDTAGAHDAVAEEWASMVEELYEATRAAEDAHRRVEHAAAAQATYAAVAPIVLPPLPSFVALVSMDAPSEGGRGDGAGPAAGADARARAAEEERLCVYVSKYHPIRGTIGRSLVVTSAAITSYDLNATQPKQSSGAAAEAAALDDGEGAIAEGRQTNAWSIDRLCCVRSTFCDNVCMVAFQVRSSVLPLREARSSFRRTANARTLTPRHRPRRQRRAALLDPFPPPNTLAVCCRGCYVRRR
jgi:hypothetical protein